MDIKFFLLDVVELGLVAAGAGVSTVLPLLFPLPFAPAGGEAAAGVDADDEDANEAAESSMVRRRRRERDFKQDRAKEKSGSRCLDPNS